MSVPDPIDVIARGWNREPSSSLSGRDASGVSAALWTHASAGVQEVLGEANDTHYISIVQRSFEVEVFADGRRRFGGRAPRGAVQIMRAGEFPRAVQHGSWQILHVYLDRGIVGTLANEISSQPVELIDPACTTDFGVDQIGRGVLAEMKRDLPLSRLRVDALGIDLAIQLLRRHSTLTGSPALARHARGHGLAPWQQRRAVELLTAHLAEDVALAEVAATVNLSPFHFARQFKRSIGCPPSTYHRHLRCEKAKELLVATDLPVGEIAAQVGYETPQAFARMFRAETGATPSSYRRERQS